MMRRNHFLHTVKLTHDTLPSLQKYGCRITRQVEIQRHDHPTPTKPKINQVLRFLKGLKGLRLFKMKTSFLKSDYGQMVLLSKRLVHIKKLELLVIRDHLKNYKKFFTLTKLADLNCSFDYEGEWKFIRPTPHRILFEKECPDPLHLLIYQNKLQVLALTNLDRDQPHLPNLLNFRRYPQSLRRVELNNLNKPGTEQILSSTNHLTFLTSIKFDLIWNHDDDLLLNLIQAFAPIFPQLEEFEIRGININQFLRYITDLPFKSTKIIKAECYNPFSVLREEHIFLTPSQHFQKSLSLKLNSVIGVRNHLRYFPDLQILDLHMTNYLSDNASIVYESFQLFEFIDQFSLLKDLSIRISLYKSAVTRKLNLLDHFKKFFTRGIPLEGFRISIDLIVNNDDVIKLYKELEKHALSLKRLKLAYKMVNSETHIVMDGVLSLLEKLKSIEQLELPGLTIVDHNVPRLLMSLFAMSKLKILFLSEFYLCKEIPYLVKAQKALKRRMRCNGVDFVLCDDNMRRINGDSKLAQIFSS